MSPRKFSPLWRHFSIMILFVCVSGLSGGNGAFSKKNGSSTRQQWTQSDSRREPYIATTKPRKKIIASVEYDPLFTIEMSAGAKIHYQVPLIRGDLVFMEFKSGHYSASFESEIWHERCLRWSGGRLVQAWDFVTDWKPVPIEFVGASESLFQPVLTDRYLYVPGSGGTVFKLDPSTGKALAQIKPFGEDRTDTTFISGPLTADQRGNVYYNVLQIDRSKLETADSWLFRIAPDDEVREVSYSELLAPANPPNKCSEQFEDSRDLPWPPSEVPPIARCGVQRPGVNVGPAIAPDGTIYTISRADLNSRYGYIIALDSGLGLKWAVSLRDHMRDGCGVLLPIPSALLVKPGNCRFGTRIGVDPETNELPAGRVVDQSSSSPVALPDGSVVYGAYSRYNGSRGHLYKFSSAGQFLGAYDYGWDITPAVFRHDGTYSIILKDNHFFAKQNYCDFHARADAACGPSPETSGPFFITQLDPQLHAEWRFQDTEARRCSREPTGELSCVKDPRHSTGFAWCVNAPGIDSKGIVYASSDDGFLYMIPQGHRGEFTAASPDINRVFLKLSIAASYTPVIVSGDTVYVQNAGTLFAAAD